MNGYHRIAFEELNNIMLGYVGLKQVFPELVVKRWRPSQRDRDTSTMLIATIDADGPAVPARCRTR